MSRTSTARASGPARRPVRGESRGAAPLPTTGLPTPAGPRLRAVPPRAAQPARAPFVVLVAGLLAAGLVGLLLLNTMLAQDAFVLHDLQRQTSELTDRQQALEQQVAIAASPQHLSAEARALGMVRSTNPVFLRVPLTGARRPQVLGVPKPGIKPRIHHTRQQQRGAHQSRPAAADRSAAQAR